MMKWPRKLSAHLLPVDIRATGRRHIRLVGVLVAIGFGGWQAAQFDWSEAGVALDQALWTQALKDRPSVSELQAVVPVWREREGASGDRILERVDRNQAAADGSVAVINDVGGEAIPAPVLAKQAASYGPDDALPVEPARFNGLTEGDRLTISTKDGQIYTFEVVSPARAGNAEGVEITIRMTQADGESAPVLHAIRPVAPQHAGQDLSQHEL